MNPVRIAASWSGGKDSCLALHRAIAAGATPHALLTVFDDEGARSRSHGLRPEVLAAQANALGLPLATARASWQDYEARFREQLARLAAQGVTDVVFGDIDLEPHREWEERVCEAEGLRAWLPLWQHEREELLTELWAAGYRCRIVAVAADRLGKELLGRELTPDLTATFRATGIDPCGENGEYHTVVVDGPTFRSPVELTFGAIVESGGCYAVDASVTPSSLQDGR